MLPTAFNFCATPSATLVYVDAKNASDFEDLRSPCGGILRLWKPWVFKEIQGFFVSWVVTESYCFGLLRHTERHTIYSVRPTKRPIVSNPLAVAKSSSVTGR